jgi:AraC-like DNA-binding protein
MPKVSYFGVLIRALRFLPSAHKKLREFANQDRRICVYVLERPPGEDVREPLREAVRQWAALVRAGSPLSEGIRRAVAYLHAHYTSPDLTREKVAREARLCPSRFSRAFHQEKGVTYARYLTDLRMEEAKRLLAGTSRPLEEIASAVGYEHLVSFDRAFKRVVGVPPSQYRRQLEGKAGSP